MPETVRGHATPDLTRAFADRFPALAPHGHVPLGGTGLTAGRLGFGCYRIDDRTSDHRKALLQAVGAGCNLIDTSTNYTDGASERLVGAAVRELVGGGVERGGLIIVSKIGYVQGVNLELALSRESSGAPFPEMVRYMEGCWHCIHPEFLEDQLNRSLERLGLETLDVCLLHNPEYFLSDAARRSGGDPEAARVEFYRRLREAFGFLESAARHGRIGCYGVSSNTAVNEPGDFEATSLTRMLEAARDAGGDEHRFRVLQIPMNLFEPGGALTRNTGEGNSRTPLESAAAAGVGVLINRPLNAFTNNRLVRLAEPMVRPPRAPLLELSRRFTSLEKEFRDEVAPSSRAAEAAENLFRLFDQVVELPTEVQDHLHWQQIEQQYILPRVHMMLDAMRKNLDEPGRSRWNAWWERFEPETQELLAAAAYRAAENGRSGTKAIVDALDMAIPESRRGESLSRKSLWVLTSTGGVGTVLVGMRRPAYVADATAILAWPPVPDPLTAYNLVRERAMPPAPGTPE